MAGMYREEVRPTRSAGTLSSSATTTFPGYVDHYEARLGQRLRVDLKLTDDD